jgi:hypothetical protein
MISSVNAKVLKPALISTIDRSGYDLEVNKSYEISTEVLDLLPIIETIAETRPLLQIFEGGNMIVCLSNSKKLKECPRFVNKEHFYRILAWYITEGWTNIPKTKTTSSYSSGISQSLKANLLKVDSIIESLKITNIPYKLQFSKKLHNNIPQEMTVYLSGIISLILQSCGKKSSEKIIPKWLYDSLIKDKEFVRPFFETMIAGDGHQNLSHISYISKSKILIEQMCFLGNILGYGISIVKPTKKRSTYVINFLSPRNKIALSCLGEGKFNSIRKITKEEYDDNVFDITVEKNHNFFAGEFGQILISNSIYPDCRQEFRDTDYEAFKLGNWGSEKVKVSTPFLHVDKFEILKHGLECCDQLGLDFDEVYKRTNTSYKPIYIEYPRGYTMEDMRNGPEGDWYSDYKSASSVERIEAFIKLGRPDPVLYADETGPVSWEVAKAHVETILNNHEQEKR